METHEITGRRTRSWLSITAGVLLAVAGFFQMAAAGPTASPSTADPARSPNENAAGAPRALPLAAPQIRIFTTDLTAVYYRQATTLRWDVAHATACEVSGGWSGPRPTVGAERLMPAASTTYVLTCSGAGGRTIRKVDVNLHPPVILFAGSPMAVRPGKPVELRWHALNVSGCEASGAHDWSGRRSDKGRQAVHPRSTTIFSLRCAQGERVETRVVRVLVKESLPLSDPDPALRLVVVPSTIREGHAAMLGWISIGLEQCEASGSWAGIKKQQGREPVVPIRTGLLTFALTCRTAEGLSTTKTATLRVKH